LFLSLAHHKNIQHARFYDISHGSIESLVREIKEKIYRIDFKTSVSERKKIADQIEKSIIVNQGVLISDETRRALHSGPRSLIWQVTSAWLKKYFEQYAEPQPNRRGEHHLSKGGN